MGVIKTYIIVVDGMRADYIGSMGHQGLLTPTMSSLLSEGVYFNNCTSIMPANTGTNHTAILTSAYAESHGILGIGGYYSGLDFTRPWFSSRYGNATAKIFTHKHLRTPTIFNIIKERDATLKTAFITGKTWLGRIIPDEDCDIIIYPGNTPGNSDEYNPNPNYVTLSEGYVLGGLAHLEDNEIFPRVYIPRVGGDMGEAPPGTVNLSPVDFDSDKLPSDHWVMTQAIKCITYDDPDFLYIVLMNMDLAGHAYGSFKSTEIGDMTENLNPSMFRNPNATKDQLYITDQEIKRFVTYLKDNNRWNTSRIIITSDHGMSTMKSVISKVSRHSILHWFLSKIHHVTNPSYYYQFTPLPAAERLDIDIRQILADHGIHMRAGTGGFFNRYNPRGDYDWMVSEGPNGYVYNASVETQQRIKDILTNYTITENGETIKPIWKVLIRSEQSDTINDYTGKPFKLGGDNHLDMIWPSVIIFCKPGYMIPMYNDQLNSALMPLMIKMKLPSFIDIRTATGAHGTYPEQLIPLIIVSPSEPDVPVGVTCDDPVSVVDISPTITSLNGWGVPSSFIGSPLL
ncbi:MAG: alkaline phosphatase family protein [Candidatus Thermoplasmatota archaeon]